MKKKMMCSAGGNEKDITDLVKTLVRRPEVARGVNMMLEVYLTYTQLVCHYIEEVSSMMVQ